MHDWLVSVGEDGLWLRPVASSKAFNVGHSCLDCGSYGSVVDAGTSAKLKHPFQQGSVVTTLLAPRALCGEAVALNTERTTEGATTEG